MNGFGNNIMKLMDTERDVVVSHMNRMPPPRTDKQEELRVYWDLGRILDEVNACLSCRLYTKFLKDCGIAQRSSERYRQLYLKHSKDDLVQYRSLRHALRPMKW